MSSSKRKLDFENIGSLNISNKVQCNCGCKRCQTENQFLREKLIELYGILERKVTRQSLNSSLHRSSNGIGKTFKEVSTKACNCKKSCSNRCGCFKKDFACGSHCKCDKNLCLNMVQDNLNTNTDILESNFPLKEEIKYVQKNHTNATLDRNNDIALNNQDENFDPMKPRRQLARSPIVNNNLSTLNRSFTKDAEPCRTPSLRFSNTDVSLANASTKSMANDLPEEMQQPIIDWEKHKAELQQCPKCRRKFHPNRLDKHIAVCKKI